MTGTDVATVDAKAIEALQAQQEGEFGDDLFQTPILKIGQPLTREVRAGEAEAGEFINTLTGEGVGDKLGFIVAYYQRGRFRADGTRAVPTSRSATRSRTRGRTSSATSSSARRSRSTRTRKRPTSLASTRRKSSGARVRSFPPPTTSRGWRSSAAWRAATSRTSYSPCVFRCSARTCRQ
jgi:hypothetical protein